MFWSDRANYGRTSPPENLVIKWTLIVAGVLVAVVLLVVITGALLPRNHVVRTTTVIRGTPDDVWRTIADVASAPSWREVKTVEMLSRNGGPLRWREVSKFGPIMYEQVEAVPAQRFVSRIADTDQGFGGTWSFALAPDTGGTRVTITEDGFVSNPLFRFMSRFVFGYYGTQEAYLRALGKKYGQEVAVSRL